MPPWENSPPEKRFDARYIPEPNTGCWLWLERLNDGGYGVLSVSGREVRAHVFSYTRFVGRVPKGKFVLHKCDVRCCVNPEHLKTGSKKQNTQDAIERRRFPTGMKHSATTLTDQEVVAIRNDSRKQRIIAEDYGVCQMTISNIKRRFTWKYVA